MRRLPPLRSIQAFEAAARHGSILRAADELHVTPSAVSHQIKQLEAQLGIQLFHRAHRSIILTEPGRRYANAVGASFESLDDATRAIAARDASDILSIQVVPSLAVQWLMPCLPRFTIQHPNIDVRLHASHAMADLGFGEADIEVRYGPFTRRHGMVVVPFPPEPILVLCSPALMAGDRAIATPDDVRCHQLIHSEVNLYGWAEWQADHPGVALSLKRGARFDRSFLSISEAVHGRGVCLESRLLVERELAAGTLVAPLGLEGPRIPSHNMVFHRSKENTPKIVKFVEFIRGLLQDV